MKAKAQIIAGILSLVALLAYTLVHTGTLLSLYINPGLFGFVAAFGIELSIVSLSLRIGELRKTKQSAGFFYFVLVSVVFVSAIANIAEGYLTRYEEHLSMSNVANLDLLQSVIGVASTGLISLIVLALSEIVGTDVKAIDGKTTKVTKAENTTDAVLSSVIDNVAVDKTGNKSDKANVKQNDKHDKINDKNDKGDKVTKRQDKILSLLSQGRQEGDIASELNVSLRTVQRDILSLNGKVTRG